MSQDWGSGWDDQQWGNQGYGQSQQHNHQQQQYQHQPNYGNYGGNDYYNPQQQQNQYEQQSQQQKSNDFYGGYNQGQSPYFLPQAAQQFMSDPMLNAAKQFGGQFAEQQKEKIAKYISGFQLKYYFAVDNTYVAKKLGLLLFPFFHSDWGLKYGNSDEPAPAKEDINAPDLYIPVMAFLTYVLVSGFVLGTQERFSPEILGILTSNAFIWIIIENIVILVSKYVMNISQALSVWHSLAYSTYKFVGMILCLLMFMMGGKTFYYSSLFYTSLALVFFLLRTVKNFVFDTHYAYHGDDGRKRKLILILFILVSQPLVMWWLTSGVTSFDYSQYDFARLAMDKMGLAPGASGKIELPKTADGDVDYEALLKMP